MKKSSYEFDDGFVIDNMGSYIELEFTGLECAEHLMIVIKHTYVESEEEKESSTQTRKQIAT